MPIMEINNTKLEALVASNCKTAKKVQAIAVQVSTDRHTELKRLCKKYKLTISDVINLVLDDYMSKS